MAVFKLRTHDGGLAYVENAGAFVFAKDGSVWVRPFGSASIRLDANFITPDRLDKVMNYDASMLDMTVTSDVTYGTGGSFVEDTAIGPKEPPTEASADELDKLLASVGLSVKAPS